MLMLMLLSYSATSQQPDHFMPNTRVFFYFFNPFFLPFSFDFLDLFVQFHYFRYTKGSKPLCTGEQLVSSFQWCPLPQVISPAKLTIRQAIFTTKKKANGNGLWFVLAKTCPTYDESIHYFPKLSVSTNRWFRLYQRQLNGLSHILSLLLLLFSLSLSLSLSLRSIVQRFAFHSCLTICIYPFRLFHPNLQGSVNIVCKEKIFKENPSLLRLFSCLWTIQHGKTFKCPAVEFE